MLAARRPPTQGSRPVPFRARQALGFPERLSFRRLSDKPPSHPQPPVNCARPGLAQVPGDRQETSFFLQNLMLFFESQ